MYKCVLFDMDGTLVNSYDGIFKSYKCVFDKMGILFEGEKFVRKVIGAPLNWVFENICKMDNENASKAVGHYRGYYSENGKYESIAYEGIKEVLSILKSKGMFIGTATLKKEEFAKEILEHLGLINYFDIVCGMDENDCLTKADIIEKCIKHAKFSKKETIMVGDSEFDAIGAKEAGVDFLAVTYGFGSWDKNNIEKFNVQMIAKRTDEIVDIICKDDKEKR